MGLAVLGPMESSRTRDQTHAHVPCFGRHILRDQGTGEGKGAGGTEGRGTGPGDAQAGLKDREPRLGAKGACFGSVWGEGPVKDTHLLPWGRN